MIKAPVYMALVHHPVVNKHNEIVTTSVTNFDIHDLARTSKTFGVEACFFVTPTPVQHDMIKHIAGYWQDGFGAGYNPDRKEAFSTVALSFSLEETYLTIKERHGTTPRLVATTAKKTEKSIDYKGLRCRLEADETPYLLLFGTGWGLAPEVMDSVDIVLDPIIGRGEYNHLPVRSAVAIILDRLLGQ